MAIFQYIGRNSEGRKVSGVIDDNSSSAAADQLLNKNIIPLTIKAAQPSSINKAEHNLQHSLTSKKVSTDEMLMFCRQMYALMRSGIPILKAVTGLAQTSKSATLKKVLIDINEQLERGYTLSAAMNNYPDVFSKLMTSIVLVGENTGQLDQSFATLARYLARDSESKRNIKQAVRYPLYVLITLVIAVFIVNIFVIPEFRDMFSQLQTELPLPTQWLISSSNLFVNHWYLLMLCLFGLFLLVKNNLATEDGRYNWDRRKLKLPVIGDIIERVCLARFAHSFSVVLSSGVPITTSLSLTADAIDNSYMASKVKAMRKSVESGEALLRTATASQLFTPLVLQMISVGEETGRLDKLLAEVADFYEREVDYDLKTLTDRIEPILISLIACLIIMLAMGVFLPMWDLYSAVQG